MLAFLRLTRPLNLLIMAATMLLMRSGLIGGHLERGLTQLLRETESPLTRADIVLDPGFGPQLPLHLFILLILSTVFIAAGGNVINDYFDTRIDRINKPDGVIVGRLVKRRVAMMGHLMLSGAGLLFGAFVAWRAGMFHLVVVPVFAIAALWMYSTSLKRQLILGNGTVALLTALVPLTVGLYEIPALQATFAQHNVVSLSGESYRMEIDLRAPWHWIFGFSAFAFMTTLVRELQKDMADVKGDEVNGCRTIPIVWGMRWAKVITLIYIAALIVALLFLHMAIPALHGDIPFWYMQVGIIAPLLLSAGFTYNAVQREEHIRAAGLMKVAMVAGVCFAVIIRFLP